MNHHIDGISVIVPAYNSSRTIDETIQSVISQTYKNWEIIIIDDCSTDQTGIIIEKYTKRFKNIKLLKMGKNSGVSAARNRGVQEAKYEWVAFLDSDDLWKAQKLEKQVFLANNYPEAVLFYTGSSFIDNFGNKQKYILQVPLSVSYNNLLPQNIISCSSVLVKKDQLLKNKMPEENDIHEDFFTWLRILYSGNRAYGIQEPLLIYRLTDKSKSSNKIVAAKMNWKVYQKLGISFFKRLNLMGRYMLLSTMKYMKIKSQV